MQAASASRSSIENKPGAGTNIALRALIDSPPDGYTLMLTANAVAANVSLYDPPPYDLGRDITPIALVGRVPVVLAVGAQSEYTTIEKFVAAAKAKPEGGELRDARQRLDAAPRGRAVRARRRHLADARPVQGRLAGDHRRDGRPRAGGGGQCAGSAAARARAASCACWW